MLDAGLWVCTAESCYFVGPESLVSRIVPLSQRLQLLLAPTVFTIYVGAGTYILAERYKRNRFRYQQPISQYGVITGILCANLAVTLLWQSESPAVLRVLEKYMLADVYGNARTLSMLGATCSHMSIPHLMANMQAFLSMANIVEDPCTFLHIYLTGGLVAVLGSYLRGVLRPQIATKSLGASGAILSVTGYIMGKYSEARFSVPLLDQLIPHSFTSQTAFWCIVGFSVCGLLLDWRPFEIDHAAHLSGLCYGWLKGRCE